MQMEPMQGRLQRWIGYVQGWQWRWCVLESGILSFATAAGQDYEGSINVKKARLQLHAHDMTQFEIHLPSQDIIYLKANTEPVRQNWLDCIRAHSAKLNELNLHFEGHLSEISPESAQASCVARHEELVQQVMQLQELFARVAETPPGCLTQEQASGIYKTAVAATSTCADYLQLLQYLRSDAAVFARSAPSAVCQVPISLRPPPRPASPTAPATPPPATRALPAWERPGLLGAASAEAGASSSSSPATTTTNNTSTASTTTATTASASAVPHFSVPGGRYPPPPPPPAVMSDSSECASMNSVIQHDTASASSAPTSPYPEQDLSHDSSVHFVSTITVERGSSGSEGAANSGPSSPANPPSSSSLPAASASAFSPPAAHAGNLPAPPPPAKIETPLRHESVPVSKGGRGAAGGQGVGTEEGFEGECTTPVPSPLPAAHLEASLTGASAPSTTTTTSTFPSKAESVGSSDGAAVSDPVNVTDLSAPPPSSAVVARGPAEQTFFTLLPHKFSEALPTEANGAIPTLPFLQACRGILSFLDVLGSTTFAPVKSDISGNINKLTARMQEDPLQNVTLQAMVRLEMMKRTTTAKNSATDALLWLKRALEFINVLLVEVADSQDESLSGPATKAYTQTLSRYHGWMVRGIFNLAMKSVPYRADFLTSLGPAPAAVVLADMRSFTATLHTLLATLAAFYAETKLDK